MPKSPQSSSEKKKTIYDIALMTKVSPGTVSRALNGKGNVSRETKEKILRAAQELGVKPGSNARTKVIAVLNEGKYTDTVIGYAATLSTHLNFSLAEKEIAAIHSLKSIEELNTLFLDGVIAVTYDKDSERKIAELEKSLPVVYMDKFDIQPQQHVVRSDHHQSGYLAALHLIDSGKSKLAYFAPDATPFRKRLDGYTEAINERGLSITPDLYALSGRKDNIYSSIAKLIHNGCDSIYIPGSSLQALEAMHVIQYVMKARIPEDISIIGGENEGLSKIVTPPLTTVIEPLEQMAETAVDMLSRLIEGETIEEKVVTLPVSISQRASVSHTQSARYGKLAKNAE